ncbi:MAG: pitrilysin family protein [Nanoarchaeota archaeon]
MKMDSKGYREFTLDNGLVVALQNTPTQTVAGRLRVHSGGLHELPNEEGLAHFVEHTLVMGGSKKYSPGDVKKINSTLGYLNAFTSSSETTFPVDMLAEDVELYLDFLSDVVSSPRFDEQIVEQERQRVLRELADRKSTPGFKEGRMVVEALFGPSSPHAYNVMGREEIIAKATADDLRKIHERGYHAKNMDLILVGGLPEGIEDLISEKFSVIPEGINTKIVFPRNPPLKKRTVIHSAAPELYNHENPRASSAYFQFAFPTSTFGDSDHYIVMMLAQILCSSSNSYLFQRLSCEMGLAYYIEGGYDFSNNAGVICVSGKIDASRIPETIEAAFGQMKELQEECIPGGILKSLIRNGKYSMAKNFESNSGHINAIQFQLDHGCTYEMFFTEVDKVTPEQVREAAQKYLPASDGNYVLLLKDPLK